MLEPEKKRKTKKLHIICLTPAILLEVRRQRCRRKESGLCSIISVRSGLCSAVDTPNPVLFADTVPF